MADHIYISPANGDDGTGDGSEGNPYASFPTAEADTSATPNATVFHMGNSGTMTQTAEWVWTNGAGSKWTYSRPVLFLPWDEGGSGVHYRTINGITVPEWVIDQNTTDMWNTGEAPSYCGMVNLRVEADGSTGTTGSAEIGANSYMSGVVVKNSDNTYGIRSGSSSIVTNCAVVTDNATNYPNNGIYAIGSPIISCLVDGVLQNAVATADRVESCVFKNWGGSSNIYEAIAGGACGNGLIGNAFIGNGGNAICAWECGSSISSLIVNNIFHTLTYGLLYTAAFDSGPQVLGGNAFYNVTTNYSKDSPPTVYNFDTYSWFDLTGHDVELDEDPFVDHANHDYRLKSTSLCRGRGIVFPLDLGGWLKASGASVSVPSSRRDIGPCQYGFPNLPFAGSFLG